MWYILIFVAVVIVALVIYYSDYFALYFFHYPSITFPLLSRILPSPSLLSHSLHFFLLSLPLLLPPSIFHPIFYKVWDNKSFSNTPVASVRFPVGDLQVAKKVRTHTRTHARSTNSHRTYVFTISYFLIFLYPKILSFFTTIPLHSCAISVKTVVRAFILFYLPFFPLIHFPL